MPGSPCGARPRRALHDAGGREGEAASRAPAKTRSLTGYQRMTGVCALVLGREDEEAAGLATKMGFAAGTSSCGEMCACGVGGSHLSLQFYPQPMPVASLKFGFRLRAFAPGSWLCVPHPPPLREAGDATEPGRRPRMRGHAWVRTGGCCEAETRGTRGDSLDTWCGSVCAGPFCITLEGRGMLGQ